MNELRPGSKVRFAHMTEKDSSFTIKELLTRGLNEMATLEELPGEYARHLFVLAPPEEPAP